MMDRPGAVAVKICGINDDASYRAAADAGADWVGFVFHPASPRAVPPARAAALAQAGGPATVALFVDPTDAMLDAVLAAFRPDVLQLHGVTPARARAVAARVGLPCWRAVGVAGPADLPRSAEGADRILFDARPEAGADAGGNGTPFDWTALAGRRPGFDWMLAGGLTPDNVAAAIAATGAGAVDVSSGVERARGVKDPVRIAAFVARARAWAAG